MLCLIQPIAYWGISLYGSGYWADEAMIELERTIQVGSSPGGGVRLG
jgi:hypothetical protein